MPPLHQKDLELLRIFVNKRQQSDDDISQQRARLKKYQRFLQWFPFIFIGVTFILIYIMSTLLSVNPPVFILLFIATILLLREISTLVFSYRMRKNLMVPLEKLQAGVVEISKGNYGYQIDDEMSYMVRDLVESFNVMSRELKQVNEVNNRYEANRKELIAGISHDLKTPISSILGYIEGIQEGLATSPDKYETYLNIIHKNAVYTNTLIDDLFLFSKIDINQMVYNFENVAVGEYFQDIFVEKSIELEEQNVAVDYRINLKREKIIPIDSKMMYRVVSNIISNALKYNSKEEKHLHFELSDYTERYVKVSVKDNGNGIPKEQLEAIFSVFYRGDEARNKDVGGTGLGLSIARQLVEAHGGRIWANSDLGDGTTISFTLSHQQRSNIK